MTIGLTSEALGAMKAHAAREYPRECCGILLGRAERIETAVLCRNVHAEPLRHFEIDPQALVDAHRAERSGGPEVIGYYHSHPDGPARPSAIDQANASGDGRIWAIVAGEQVTFWRDERDGFRPVRCSTPSPRMMPIRTNSPSDT